MNTALSFRPDSAQTMSSFEISELVESRHDKVKQSIERLAARAIIELPPMGEIKTATKPAAVYLFSGEKGKRDSLVVVAQLCPEFTARVIDRWQELESQQQPRIPQSYAEALQLAADQARIIEEQRPKIEVYEKLADRKGDVSTTIIAKQLGTTAIAMNKWLREIGAKWQNADLPKAGYQDWFNVVSDVKNGHEFTQCLVTPVGQIEIAKRWEAGQ